MRDELRKALHTIDAEPDRLVMHPAAKMKLLAYEAQPWDFNITAETTMFCGIRVVVDTALPDGVVEIWQSNRRLARIENLA